MKKKLQQLLKPALMVLGTLGVAVALGFVAHHTNSTPVKEIAVDLSAADGMHFIDENTVRQHVLAHDNEVVGNAVGDVDLRTIENELREIPCVARAEVYHTMDGVLHVKLTEREPIVRVINNDGSSFYIDRNGWTMPLSDHYTARVPVVTGMLFEPFANTPPVNVVHTADSLHQLVHSDEIHSVMRTITADPFWNALIDQAVVDVNGEFELVPRIGGQRIRIGNGQELEERLAKVRAFYEQGIPQTDWRRYSVIDARFSGQVVCTRKQAQ